MRRGFNHVCADPGSALQPRPREKRKDIPELFFPRGLTPISDGLESRPCPGTRVRNTSRLIVPQNPPRHQGVGPPLMDGHPHRFSTDFEHTLLRGHPTRRGVGPLLGVNESLWVRDRFW
jgi:hypothetical protein